MGASNPRNPRGPDPASMRRQILDGYDLVADGSIPLRKLSRAFLDSLPPLPDVPGEGADAETPTPPSGDGGGEEQPGAPAYHGENYKSQQEIGTPEANERETAARGRHSHDYQYQDVRETLVDPNGNDSLLPEAVTEVNSAPFPQVGADGSTPESWRCITWMYDDGATYSPFHIWGQTSADGGATWSEPTLVGVAAPGERQFVYKSRLDFSDANVMDRYVVVALNHNNEPAFRVPRAGYDGKLDIDWLPSEVATDTEVAAAVAVETARATAAEAALTSSVAAEAAARAAADLLTILKDGSRAFTGDQSMGSHKITNLTDPGSAQDADTKAARDAAIAVETARATAAEVVLAAADATEASTRATADSAEAAARAAADALLLVKSANLSDVASAATSRTNLGLGSAATLASDTDTALAANSDSRVATQKATKAYADAVAAAAAVYFPAGILPKTANYTVVTGDKGKLVVVTPAAVTTITLPTAPADAFAIGVLAANTSSAVKIAAAGADVFSGNLNGTTTLYTMAARECIWFVYESATALWRVMSWAPQAAGTGTYGAAKVASAGTAGAALSATDATTTDARTPTSHASSHDSGGSDAMAADAAAGTPSLRSLGTTSVKACAGDDSRLSDSRAPNGAAGGVLGGTYPNPTFASGVYTPNFLYKSSAQTLIGTAFTDISSLTFSVAANKSYFFEFFIIADADATTTGIDVAVNGPTIGAGTITYEQVYWTSTTAFTTAQATAYDNNTASANSNGTTARIFRVWGILVNGANAGTLAARIKREAVGTGPNVRAGSWGRWALLN